MDVVARKGDISIIVLLSFFYIQIDIDGIGIEGEYRITYDFGIPIASGVVEIDHTLLVIPEVTSDEFGSIEEVQFEIPMDISNDLFVRYRVTVDNGLGRTFRRGVEKSRENILENMNPRMLLSPFHFLFDPTIGYILIPVDGNLVDTDLASLVYIKAELDTVGQGGVPFLDHLHGSV